MTPRNRAILISSLLTGAAAAASTFLVMKARDPGPRGRTPTSPASSSRNWSAFPKGSRSRSSSTPSAAARSPR